MSRKDKNSGMSLTDRLLKGMDESWIRVVKLAEKYFLRSDHGDSLANLTKPQQVLILIYVFRGDVLNGGLHQYFVNSYSNNTHETLEALQIIGAVETAAILQEAIAVWPGGIVPKDREVRWQVMDEIEEKANPIWDDCTSRFYNGQESILNLLYAYMDINKNEFKLED